MNSIDSAEEALAQTEVIEAINRGIMSLSEGRVKYQLGAALSDFAILWA
jgi:hypothetical protein